MNKEILELMLQAERREIPIATCLEPHAPNGMDPFDEINTVVEFVKLGVEFDEQCRGEIDATDQGHYLRGKNYDPMMDPEVVS